MTLEALGKRLWPSFSPLFKACQANVAHLNPKDLHSASTYMQLPAHTCCLGSRAQCLVHRYMNFTSWALYFARQLGVHEEVRGAIAKTRRNIAN